MTDQKDPEHGATDPGGLLPEGAPVQADDIPKTDSDGLEPDTDDVSESA